MKRKKVLMATSNHWTSSFRVGSHHLANGFIDAGFDVAFISAPISPIHILGDADRELIERFNIYRSGGIKNCGGHLWAYAPAAFLIAHNKPFLKSKWVFNNQSNMTLPNVVKKVKKQGFGEVDLLYIDNVHQSYWLKNIDYRKSMLRMADNIAGFDNATPVLVENEQRVVSRVDLVAFTAKQLERRVASMAPKKMTHLPNGVNFKHFEPDAKRTPVEMENIPHPIAIYVGAMERWFDYDLINKAASELPDVSFVLIGPEDLVRSKIKNSKNVHLIGRRSYEDIPAYLHNADLGIIPFNTTDYADLVHGINPLKLYEYFACGLPVVSADWEELRNIDSPVILYRTDKEFIKEVAKAVSDNHDRARFKKYASEQDWSTRVIKLLEILQL